MMGLETRVGTCFQLKELDLKVVMMRLEGGDNSLDGWESCGDVGAMKVVWIRGVHNCVELLGPWDRLFLKLRRVFGDTGGGKGMTGEDGHFGV